MVSTAIVWATLRNIVILFCLGGVSFLYDLAIFFGTRHFAIAYNDHERQLLPHRGDVRRK